MSGELGVLEARSFIAGDFIAGTGETIEVFNPWDGARIAEVSSAAAGQVSDAIAQARHAFDRTSWPYRPPAERGALLQAIAAGLRERRQEIARIEALNAGKAYAAALQEVDGAQRVFTYYSGAVDKFFGETIQQGAQLLNFTLREPLGVVGQIVPWNFPLLGASWKLAPALAAGCCVLLKPSPATPLSVLALAEIIRAAGVPDGVVSILPGGAEVGRILCEDERVDGISFTGSTRVGSEIMRMGAGNIKRLMLELGGKNANIVFGDANIERAASMAAGSAFGNAGQSCSARSRILVHRQAAERFAEALTHAASALRPGGAFDPATNYGPLISQDHRKQVAAEVGVALDQGASLAHGGEMIDREGFFFQPTILNDVREENPIFTREVFGPVCSITVFDDDDEAISLANQSEYGLNGSVWSENLGRALRTVRALRTGMVSVNGLASASRNSVYAPFGGYKRSGLGRELGMNSLQFYTEVKTVTVDHGDFTAGFVDLEP